MATSEQNKVERLYPRLANYNMLRVIEKMKDLYKKEGAKILTCCDHLIEAKPRTSLDASEEHQQAVENLPIIKVLGYKYTGFSYSIIFVKDGFFYKVTYNDNPFFPVMFQKIEVSEDGSYTGKRYVESAEEHVKEGTLLTMAYDQIFGICDDATIEEMAKDQLERIKKVVINGKDSVSYEKGNFNIYKSTKAWETAYVEEVKGE